MGTEISGYPATAAVVVSEGGRVPRGPSGIGPGPGVPSGCSGAAGAPLGDIPPGSGGLPMKWLFFALLVIHGLIHLMGPAKAFGIADLPQLTQPISRAGGVAWLAAAVAMLVTAVLLIGSPRLWWVAGLMAVLLSQAVIVASWSDAKFGTIANVLVLGGVLYGFASQGPLGLRAEYAREVRERLVLAASLPLVTEGDLASLPEPVQRYLRLAGVLGQPRVHHFRANLRGRIRSGPDDPWMEFTAEQYNFLSEPARFFLMDARRSGLPVDVFHAFRGGAATMRVRLLSMLSLVDVGGPELTRAETVTLFNDLCLFAPGALIDPAIRWESIDEHTARAHYTVGSNTISAELSFNDAGEWVDFTSDDRLALSADGKEFVRQRWSTPVGDYQSFGPWRVMSHGEGRWHVPEGVYVYIELELLDLEVNGDPWY